MISEQDIILCYHHIILLYSIKKNSFRAEGRPCAPQGLASLVQSLCGCLLQRLVRKPCAEPCADVFPKRPLFFSVALQKNKMVGLEKVPCAVPCAGLRRPCAGFFGWMDHSGAHVARSGATPKTRIRQILK